jgi:hypothetical protein|tara:strand:- start:534 stop:878 length:345 start_codon:yes stop_codon:yes gene_type:complete
MEQPIYRYWGRVKIGFSYDLSWTAQGFGTIKFYQDRIVASAFPFKKTIPYTKIKKLVWSASILKIFGGYLKIEHESGGIPYVAFWMLGKNNPELTRICRVLKSKGVVWEEIKDL